MERRGLNYRSLSELAGMSPTNAHKVLSQPPGRYRGMTIQTAERLCRAMNCGLRYRPGDGWHATE